MNSVKGKIVLVTGASSGIGRSCARVFAREGASILMAARRKDRLMELSESLAAEFRVPVRSFVLDVRNRAEVEKALAGLPDDWKEIDVLVNNAGLSRGLDKFPEGLIPDWDEMIDTNVKGLAYVSRAVLPGMVARKRGQVINIGSIAGHELYPGGNMYCASKFAVKALTRGLRLDLNGTNIRVSTIDPGMVETEFSEVRFHGDKERAKKVYQGFTPLSPDDVAETVLFCATRPPHVDISEVIIMPTDQASATLVHRK
jgi:3-hydroxy acid dehydrogenase/malonic semialdehyde reductase